MGLATVAALLVLQPECRAFTVRGSPSSLGVASKGPSRRRSHGVLSRRLQGQQAVSSSSSSSSSATTRQKQVLAKAYTAAGLATGAAWATCSYVALSWHPNAAIHAVCGFRHNALTIAQAYGFPLLATCGVTSALRSAALEESLESATARRMNLSLGAASLWLALAAYNMPWFAKGYSMYPTGLRYSATAAHSATAALCLWAWTRSVEGTDYASRLVRGLVSSVFRLAPADDREGVIKDGRSEYALCAALFAWFTLLPVVSPFPLATIPSILGSRMSRAASAFTWLAATAFFDAKCLIHSRGASSAVDPLRRTLAIGSAAHLFVAALKLVGLDGGGLILPGRGLWQFYANSMAVPFAAASSLAAHALAIFAFSSASSAAAAATTTDSE